MPTRLIGTDSDDPWLPDIVSVHAVNLKVQDAAGYFDAVDVEGVLAELHDEIDAVIVAAGMTGPTVDTGEDYRVIMFSDGTTRAIPATATAPGIPTELARTVRINSVNLTWTPVAGATTYRVYRDGSFYATSSSPTYRDSNVNVSSTYTYAVQAVNTYSLRSVLSSSVTAFIDPALNVAPTVEVRTWPTTIALGNRAIVRVNAADADAQLLATTLGTSVGSLVATADPSVWILTPV